MIHNCDIYTLVTRFLLTSDPYKMVYVILSHLETLSVMKTTCTTAGKYIRVFNHHQELFMLFFCLCMLKHNIGCDDKQNQHELSSGKWSQVSGHK